MANGLQPGSLDGQEGIHNMSRFAGLPCRMSPDHDRPSSPLSTYRPTRSRLLRLAAGATLSLSLPFALGVSALLPAGGATAAPASAAALAATGLLGAIGEPGALEGPALGFGDTELAGTLAFGDPKDPPQPSDAPPPEPPSEGEESDGASPDEAPEAGSEEADPAPEAGSEEADPPIDEEAEAVQEAPAVEAAPAAEAVPAPAKAPEVAAPAPVFEAVPAAPAPAVAEAPVAEAPAAVEDTDALLAARGVKVSGIARRYVGSAYRYGAAGPRAFDCSGLTRFVYRQLGVNLPHKASLQYSERYGKRIATISQLRPGDLVFFKNTAGRGITHVAIYVGEGMMVTANTPRQGVQLASIHSSYWRSHWAGGIRPGL